MEKKKNILLDNYLVKNLRAYPVLKKKFMHYIEGTKELPEGFTKRKLFHDYLKVRRNNPEKRVSQSEYMIFGRTEKISDRYRGDQTDASI